MKALSIKQPWASLIALGIKDVENREWGTAYRGSFLIHASKAYDRLGHKVAEEMIASEINADMLPRGAIIGRATLRDCVDIYDDDAMPDSIWFVGRYGIFLDAQNLLGEPIPYKGMLSLFEVPDAIVENAEWIDMKAEKESIIAQAIRQHGDKSIEPVAIEMFRRMRKDKYGI